jgi:hypothetical protein
MHAYLGLSVIRIDITGHGTKATLNMLATSASAYRQNLNQHLYTEPLKGVIEILSTPRNATIHFADAAKS